MGLFIICAECQNKMGVPDNMPVDVRCSRCGGHEFRFSRGSSKRKAEAAMICSLCNSVLIVTPGEIVRCDHMCAENRRSKPKQRYTYKFCKEIPKPATIQNVATMLEKDISAQAKANKTLRTVRRGKKLVTIISPVLNNADLTAQFLESIRKHLPTEKVRVVIIDNGSNDATPDLLRTSIMMEGDVVIQNPINMGFSIANNQGLLHSIDEYTLFVNNDTIIQSPDFLKQLVAHAGKADLVGAQMCKVAIGKDQKHFRFDGLAVTPRDKMRYLEGWCLFGRTAYLKKMGGFDERFAPAYSEDADLSWRVLEKRGKLLADNTLPIHHLGSKTANLFPSTSAQSMISARKLFDKWKKKQTKLSFLSDVQH